MDKRSKIKLIIILIIAIVLGCFVVSVTAQTISQDTSQDREGNSLYSSQGCHEQQYRSCCKSLPIRGCC